jgi:hypothetical protein
MNGGPGRKFMLGKLWAVILVVATIVTAGFRWPADAIAQSYPDRSVRMVVAFPAGGTIDTLGRIVAQKLTEAWGQNVLVENRAGASGNIGAQAAAQAAPDGYTLHLGAQTLAVNVTLAPAKGFDPTKDFEPIMLVATAQDVLMVPPDSPFRSVRELIDHAKANPGQLNYASQPIGFKHAGIEVVCDVLKRAKDVEKPETIRDAIRDTDYESIVGRVSFKDGPVRNVSRTPLVGGQWKRGTASRYDLVIVNNQTAPQIPIGGSSNR